MPDKTPRFGTGALTRSSLAGKVALVTGAGQGIGMEARGRCVSGNLSLLR